MSAETYAALEDAIRAHVGDETGQIATDWILLSAAVGAQPDVTTYLDACSQTAGHSLEGLISRGLRRIVDRQDNGPEE